MGAAAAVGAGVAVAGLVSDLFFSKSGGGSSSGAFQNVSGIGMDFSEFLQERLNTPAEESIQFKLGSSAIRDALSAQTATARQRFGDSANTGGFVDSGAVNQGNLDISQAEFRAMGEAMTSLILGLEQQRTDLVLPFLAASSGESVNIKQLNTAATGQRLDFWANFLSGDTSGGNSASGLTSTLSFLPDKQQQGSNS